MVFAEETPGKRGSGRKRKTHTDGSNREDRIRIISARGMSRKERNLYEAKKTGYSKI